MANVFKKSLKIHKIGERENLWNPHLVGLFASCKHADSKSRKNLALTGFLQIILPSKTILRAFYEVQKSVWVHAGINIYASRKIIQKLKNGQ